MANRSDRREELDERIVHIARTAKVQRGGRRFAFRVVVVVGDNNGRVGVGVGKARDVPSAIHKGIDRAKRNMVEIPMVGSTIPHEVTSRSSGAKVWMKPASPGTGVIAGGGVRAVVEAAGIRDILTKSLGSDNILNVVYATFDALQQLKSPQDEARRRGLPLERVQPFWSQMDGGQNGG